MIQKISRRGFLGTIVGGLAALAIAYAAGGCASTGTTGQALREEESYARAPRAGVEVVEEDHLEKIVREMREALEESDEILKGDFQTYLSKDSVSSRFDRLRELETSYGGATASMSGYVMGSVTDVSLRIVAGVYAGTVKVIRDGDDSFSAKGTYWQAAHPEAIERAYKEADVDRDKIITRKEVEQLSLKVFREYAAPKGFPQVDEGIDEEGNLHKSVHDKL